jgi:hypothetical protein
MKRAMLLVCLLAGALLASTKSFTVTLYEPSIIAGTELKPGDYKFELKDQKLIVRHGRETTETDVKVETNGSKYGSTTVRYTNADGKYHVQAIQIGGTNMKLTLD